MPGPTTRSTSQEVGTLLQAFRIVWSSWAPKSAAARSSYRAANPPAERRRRLRLRLRFAGPGRDSVPADEALR